MSCECETPKTDAEKAVELRILCLQIALQYGQGMAEAEKMFQYVSTGNVPTIV